MGQAGQASQGHASITVEQSIASRDDGIARVKAGEDRRTPDFFERALTFVSLYSLAMREGNHAFLTEDVVDAWTAQGHAPPEDGRAWGAVMKKARSLGYVKAVGYAPARTSNMSPKVLWRAR